MAWLNKKMMQRKAEAATVADHPLLKEADIAVDVKTAYLQGCVLATLLDDAEVSDEERTKVRNIGLSLHLTDAEIDEAFSAVQALESDDQKEQFVEEILGLLKPAPIGRFFMDDFEAILEKDGKISKEAEDLFEYFGQTLFSSSDWQKKRTKPIQAERERKEAYADLRKRLVAMIEEDDDGEEVAVQEGRNGTWGFSRLEERYSAKQYDVDAIRKEFAEIGVEDRFVSAVLKMLLPKAEDAFEAFKNMVKRADGVFASGRVSIDLFDEPQTRLYLRYVACLDQCSTIDESFHLMNQVGEDQKIGRWLTWTKTSEPKAEAKKAIIENYKSLLEELRFRATF